MKITSNLQEMNSDYLELQKIVGNLLDSPGAGGNISVKFKDSILVKSSGAANDKMKKDGINYVTVFGKENKNIASVITT
jgi:ribulose-5-phosphate 4-epimerase/fuculose-1-phosphate aldolase